MNTQGRPKQQPGQLWDFVCKHSGILPSEIGKSNDFAQWMIRKRLSRKGLWICRQCKNNNVQQVKRGDGRTGFLGRAKHLLRAARQTAKSKGYASPEITADEIVTLWFNQHEECAACGSQISLQTGYLDHDHTNGEVRGFVCRNCNLAEGLLKGYTHEQFKRFCSYVEGNKIRG
ncbi:MAG: hypothetical protein DLM69_10495 [Candidatus Chloroheliales bacterium]|nr:MAG: hypothetical protein DLM69_10495 [Chloroflexota bacterium]